jgi:hypothetical protein
MLDVHPPHHPTHTWRDFFIHIATIVVGLLIAVGLEQSVEYVHHRHQILEVRDRIHEESEVNRHILLQDLRGLTLIEARMDRALAETRTLQTKQNVPLEPINTTFDLQGFYTAAYNNAKSSGTLNLLPYDEAAMYSDNDLATGLSQQAGIDLWKALNATHAALHGRSLAELDPGEITGLIVAISDARGKAELAQQNFEIQKQELDSLLSGHYRKDIH